MNIRIGILTVSDKGASGQRCDTSGPAIKEMTQGLGETVIYEIVPDDAPTISGHLISWADTRDLHLIITTGGTGVSPRDVTPEATRTVIEREAPGLTEAMRMKGLSHTPMAMLSRAVAGIRGQTLIVNLPGSKQAAQENLAVILPVLPHALAVLRGQAGEHPASQSQPSEI